MAWTCTLDCPKCGGTYWYSEQVNCPNCDVLMLIRPSDAQGKDYKELQGKEEEYNNAK